MYRCFLVQSGSFDIPLEEAEHSGLKESVILKKESQRVLLEEFVEEEIGPGGEYKRVWKGSERGCSESEFKKVWEYYNNALVIVKCTNGSIFGDFYYAGEHSQHTKKFVYSLNLKLKYKEELIHKYLICPRYFLNQSIPPLKKPENSKGVQFLMEVAGSLCYKVQEVEIYSVNKNQPFIDTCYEQVQCENRALYFI
eukprot:TRINITY_DN5835_c0_g1_i1.p1 TRINITY_DN5835_c0_g1~~TRINITY_DN5835_c0_g1_i1.p1  ORF type:complete len:196 (+),score=11.61 TRINITY_DN5835_c0_g1_i1:352-939(+)